MNQLKTRYFEATQNPTVVTYTQCVGIVAMRRCHIEFKTEETAILFHSPSHKELVKLNYGYGDPKKAYFEAVVLIEEGVLNDAR